MDSFVINTNKKEEFIDITAEINKIIKSKNIDSGICIIYIPHTTAAVTINENADRNVPKDIVKGLEHLDFEKLSFKHSEGNSPAHIKSSIIGCSITIIINNGKMQLGTWQGIFFCEFDGPRTRNVKLKVLKES